MKNHFIISYFGNKRNEVEMLYDLMKDDIINKTTIIEPFCGSSAFSYYISTKHPKQFKYILNDNNKYLIELYLILQDETKSNEFIKRMNKIHADIFKKSTPEERKNKYNDSKNIDDIYHWLFYNRCYSIRPGLYPIKEEKRFLNYNYNDMLKAPIINFLKTENITFICGSGKDCVVQNKDNENNLIFLDPPYLQACNDYYANKDVNIYEYLYKDKITDMKAKIYLILEDTWIIRLLFEHQIKQENSKTYQAGHKKKTTHLTISN